MSLCKLIQFVILIACVAIPGDAATFHLSNGAELRQTAVAKRRHRKRVVKRRSKKKSAAVVGGSAAGGAAIGALAGGGKGAAIGALAGGGAGLVYDRKTHKKTVEK